MIRDDTSQDDALNRALAALPRTHAPSPRFPDGVLRDLRQQGLVRANRGFSARSLAAAVLVFGAGIATGIGVERIIDRGSPDAVHERTSASNAAPRLNLPEIGHSEVWY